MYFNPQRLCTYKFKFIVHLLWHWSLSLLNCETFWSCHERLCFNYWIIENHCNSLHSGSGKIFKKSKIQKMKNGKCSKIQKLVFKNRFLKMLKTQFLIFETRIHFWFFIFWKIINFWIFHFLKHSIFEFFIFWRIQFLNFSFFHFFNFSIFHFFIFSIIDFWIHGFFVENVWYSRIFYRKSMKFIDFS